LRLGPRRIVEGWLETYATGVKRRLERTLPGERAQLLSTDPRYGVGTTEYMRTQGGYGVTLECGQHDNPTAPDVAWQAIRRALAHLRMVDETAPPATARIQLLRLTEVIDKYHSDDQFSRAWASYDPVREGELIGTRHDGAEVLATRDGHIVFPNPAAVAGNEWFYFAQASTRDLGD
jgi:succinylglutamate desuccinylase